VISISSDCFFLALAALVGITISGNFDCTPGLNISALDTVKNVFDDGGSVCIADNRNGHFLKYAPYSTNERIVAGENGEVWDDGTARNQIDRSIGIYVNAHSNIYPGKYFLRQIQFWPANAVQG